jgi:hypothetical protein
VEVCQYNTRLYGCSEANRVNLANFVQAGQVQQYLALAIGRRTTAVAGVAALWNHGVALGPADANNLGDFFRGAREGHAGGCTLVQTSFIGQVGRHFRRFGDKAGAAEQVAQALD